MMKRTIYGCLLILISVVSCNQTTELDQDDLKVLIEIDRNLRETNTALLNSTETTIHEKGDRPLDVKMLEDIRATIMLRNSLSLGLRLADLEQQELPLQLEDKTLMDFVSTFTERFEQLNYGDDNSEKTNAFQQLAHQYEEDKTLLNMLLLDLQLVNLEGDLIETAAISVGSTNTFGFDGEVYAYIQSQEPKSNEPLKTVISVGHDFIGASMSLTAPEILIIGEENLPYNLESFNKGLWLLTFTPNRPGPYIIDFTTNFTPDIYPSEQYAFTGKFEVMVR